MYLTKLEARIAICFLAAAAVLALACCIEVMKIRKHVTEIVR